MVAIELVRKKKLIFIVVIIAILILIYFFVISPAIQPKFFHRDYSYEFFIETNELIYNATFIVPIPVLNNIPKLGMEKINEVIFEKGNYNAAFIQKDNILFIKIVTPTINPGEQNLYHANLELHQSEEPGLLYYPTNTRYPIGNESVFLPKNNVSIHEPVPGSYPTMYGTYHNSITIEYQIPIFVEYTTSNNTNVKIYSWISASNGWAEWGTYLQNSFRDSYKLSLNGPVHGWYSADGKLEMGEGIYLDE
jgi:hypothetical protein